MKCQACQAEMPGDARICPACGADVTAQVETPDTLTGFVEKAKAVGREAMDTDIAKDAQKLAEQAIATGKKALDTNVGKDVSRFAEDAAAAGKSAIKTRMGKEMAVGAALGAVVAIPVPFVGPVIGAALGAGIAWFRARSRGA